MLLLKNEKLYNNVRLTYLAWLLLYATLRQNVTALQPILTHNVWNLAAVLIGGGLFLWDLFFFRRALKAKYIWILAAVFAAAVLSVVINYRYSFVDNVKAVANMFIQFFVVYTVGTGLSKDRIKKEVNIIGNILCLAWFITAAISVYMYFAGIFYRQHNLLWGEDLYIVQGFVHYHDGAQVMRLWGVFVDPNFAAAVSVATIWLSIYVITVKPPRWVKALHITNVVVQFWYVVLANSRMGFLLLYITVFVGGWYAAFAFLKKLKTKNFRAICKELLSLVVAVLCLGACYLAIVTTKQALPYIRYGIQKIQQGQTSHTSNISDPNADTTDPSDNTSVEETVPPVQVEVLDRTDIEVKEDFSNGRIGLWLEGLQVFKTSPVVGVGPRSYNQVVRETDPTMRLSSLSIHNSYMELLMGGGAVGFLLMVVFFALCAKDAIVLRYRDPEGSCLVGPLMLTVLTCLGCGMFISSLFYYLSGISVLIFLLLGYAVALARNEQKPEVRA